ncbi:MAG: redox-sensing transcriptional repressor Rex [Gammaproteobacteria bacterium]|nr:redox-sensing transcriptional repressor Rex [Gammaproteobacteria bacterium]MDE0248496.1 redox-sensing transcriptional repressor Rex [Gammaproteobacteria bacterium]
MPASLHKVSDSAIRRLSIYLRVLGGLEREGKETVSSQVLADRAGTTAAQVRKDLSLFGSFGKRGLGYLVTTLRDELRGILGVSRTWRVALVGIGRMGAALLEYPHFRARGFEFVAVYDSDPEKVGSRRGMLTVEDARVLEESLRETGVEIVVLTVPAGAAQEVADAAVRAGVRGIMNFAPVALKVPPGVRVNAVRLTVELEVLSFSLGSVADRE